MKISSITVIFVTLLLLAAHSPNAKTMYHSASQDEDENHGKATGTEYWALIVGVGVYYKHPEQNRPKMLEIVEQFPGVLLESGNWEQDHIHTLKGSQATLANLINELLWLIRSSDEDDMILLYITTHGSQLKINGQPLDLPPLDEADHHDEILIMYHGFENQLSFISDDLLNIFLGLLKSKNICVIIDSCHSGGFNDPPLLKKMLYRMNLQTGKNDAEPVGRGFAEDIASQGRIVLMSCEEDKLSWGNIFSTYLLNSLSKDLADSNGNRNGINSAEEAFSFADEMVNTMSNQDPTILDLYNGEFTLTYT
jgi:hypothetical protein